MREKLIFWFLILSGSFLQTFANLPEKDSNAASDFLVRKRRIIDETHDIDESILHKDVRYVVLILGHVTGLCTGIILAAHIVLTAAHCLDSDVYVVSGVPGTETHRNHHVVNVIVHDHYKRGVPVINDLALVIVREPIDIHGYHRTISIYHGVLPPHSEGLASGWGDSTRGKNVATERVRSIMVPIIDHNACQHMVSPKVHITERHICTLYPNRQKCCWHGDSGGPLVYNDHLIGVFSTLHHHPEMADVYMNLMEPHLKMWVESTVDHIQNMAMHLH